MVQAASPEIRIEGANERLRDNVRSFIGLADEPCDTPLWRLRSRMRALHRQVDAAGRALGYYHLSAEPTLTQSDDCWALTLLLTPGEPVRIESVEVRLEGEGAEDKAFVALREQPGVSVGEPLDHGRYESFKGRFASLASARGYFDGRFERSRIRVDTDRNSARVELHYHTGPRYRFGEIEVEQEGFDPAFIRRYFTFETGEPYDTDRLLELKSRLSASGYFQSVRVSPRLQALEGQAVPVRVALERRKRHSYSMGAGYATDTGARLRLGYENRYLNDRGHRFNADATIAEVDSQVEATYTIPMTRPASEQLRLQTGYRRERTEDTRSSVTTLGTSYTRSEAGSDWLQTYSLNYEREYYEVGGQPEQRSDLLIPAFSLSRTRSEGSRYPTSGWSWLGRVSGSPSTLGSDTSFLQGYTRIKALYGLGGGRLILRAEGGFTQVDEFNELPVSQRFYAGGDASVRGYDYKDLGPTEYDPEVDRDRVVGGNHLITASVEYDYRILDDWALAVFTDRGNAFNNTDYDLKRSAGVGLRWLSPIGPVRLDLARALDGDEGWQLHLSMGPDL